MPWASGHPENAPNHGGAATGARRRLDTESVARRAIILVVLVAAMAGLWFVARDQLTLDRLIERERAVRSWLEASPWLGFAVGFGIYVLTSLVPGTAGKAIIAGWLFGFWLGLVIVNIGLTIAALISFFASRYLLRDLIASRLGPRMQRADAAIAREGPRWLFFARVLHAPYWVTNHVMGPTRISPGGFWWATQFGLLPGNAVFVYAGAVAPTLAELAEEGWWSLLSPGVIVALVVVTFVPLALPRLVEWAAWRFTGRRPRDAATVLRDDPAQASERATTRKW